MMTKNEMREYIKNTLTELDNEIVPEVYTAKVKDLYSTLTRMPTSNSMRAESINQFLEIWLKNFDMYGQLLESNNKMRQMYPNNKRYQKRTLSKRMIDDFITIFAYYINTSLLPDGELQEGGKVIEMVK